MLLPIVCVPSLYTSPPAQSTQPNLIGYLTFRAMNRGQIAVVAAKRCNFATSPKWFAET